MQGSNNRELRLSPSGASGTGDALLDRKRLLVSLLSDREAVRVICAPPLYGKTVLANQYARMAFPPSDVTWVHASEPEFLLNLDSGSFDKAVDECEAAPEKLVVFDGISKLKGKRRTNLVTLMGKLHTKQCEVMVTTEDSTLASDVELPVVVLSLFPYAGVRRTSSSFCAFELSNMGRHELMCAQFASIAPFTRYEDEDSFVLACAELCLSLGNRSLLTLGLENTDLRLRYARKHVDVPLAEELDGQVEALDDAAALVPSAVRRGKASPVRIDLFGRCEITRDGVSVITKGELRRKAKLVIALLLVNNGKELPRTWIERIVWPESNPACVRSSFYNLWSYVRRILTPPGEEPFGSKRSRDTVSFAGLNFESDVIEVADQCLLLHGCVDLETCKRALREIERLYCGPLLPGVQNDQIETYRITYQNRVLDALVDGVRVLIRGNELRLAQHYAEFAFSIDQTREDVVYQYMKAQQLLGQFSGAISAFVSCRRAMIDRFGVDGSGRLEELYEEILEEVSSSGDALEVLCENPAAFG